MGSQALQDWRGVRRERLDKLVAAHRAVAGAGPGRRWVTEEINHALLIRLASEFQGFCRDLHDESVGRFVSLGVRNQPDITSIVRLSLMGSRRIDRGNASWGNVKHDFMSSLGIDLARSLKNQAVQYPHWVRYLEWLNATRNALAHADEEKQALCAEQHPLTLATYRKCRAAVNAICTHMDRSLDVHLSDIRDSTRDRSTR